MINYMMKTIALLAILLLPTITLAQDCAAGDSNCEVTKRQTDSLKNAGINPLEATPLSLTNDKSKQAAAPTPVVQPFEIPTPGDTETKSDKDSSSKKDTSINQGVVQPFEIPPAGDTETKSGEGTSTKTQNTTATTTSAQQPINIYK